MMRACLVSDPAFGLEDAVGRLREAGLVVFRAKEWVADLGLDLGLVMGDPQRFARRHPPHRLSPAWANHPAGQDLTLLRALG
jgi:hypothetical protein